MAKSVTLVLNVLDTLFWCLSLGFGAWEIHWDHFQTPHIGLSGQNGHLWPFWVSQNKLENGNIYNFGSEHARDLILVSIPRFWAMGNSLGLFSDTSDLPEWPKRPFVALWVSQNKLEWPNQKFWF